MNLSSYITFIISNLFRLTKLNMTGTFLLLSKEIATVVHQQYLLSPTAQLIITWSLSPLTKALSWYFSLSLSLYLFLSLFLSFSSSLPHLSLSLSLCLYLFLSLFLSFSSSLPHFSLSLPFSLSLSLFFSSSVSLPLFVHFFNCLSLYLPLYVFIRVS